MKNVVQVFSTKLRFWSVFVSGNHLHRYMTFQDKFRHVDETAGLLVQRVESSIDSVVIASTELLMADQASCSDEAIALFRGLILRTSAVANLNLVAG